MDRVTLNLVPVLFVVILPVFSLDLTPLVVQSDNCTRLLKSESEGLEPNCKFEISKSAGPVEVTCPEEDVLRIVGDYDVIRIDCQAVYTFDFHFSGTKPTEAIVPEFYRREPDDKNATSEQWEYHVGVFIYGLSALQRLHKSGVKHNYSRTGRFSFQGLGRFNGFVKSFYIFLEEPNVFPKLITNRETEWPRFEDNNVCAKILCLSTHYHSVISLTSPEISGMSSVYKPTTGLRVCGLSSRVEAFTCQLRDGGRSVASKTVQSVPFPYGFLRPLEASGDVSIRYTSTWRDNTTVETFTECGGSSLATIGASNAASYRLVRDFVLPAFQSRSYTVLIGQNGPDGRLKTSTTTAFAGATYCGDDKRYRLASFSVDFEPSVAVSDFDIDWESFFGSSNATYSTIWPNASVELEENTEVSFACVFNSFLFVRPAIWSVETSGRPAEVSSNATWTDGVSERNLTVTKDLRNVSCNAPVWYMSTIEPGRAAFTIVSIKQGTIIDTTTSTNTTTTTSTTTTTTTSIPYTIPTTLEPDISITAIPITSTTVEPITYLTTLPGDENPSYGVVVICVVAGILLCSVCLLALIGRRIYIGGLFDRRFDIAGLFGRRSNIPAIVRRFRRRSSPNAGPLYNGVNDSSSSPCVQIESPTRKNVDRSGQKSMYPPDKESKAHLVKARNEAFPDNLAPSARAEETIF